MSISGSPGRITPPIVVTFSAMIWPHTDWRADDAAFLGAACRPQPFLDFGDLVAGFLAFNFRRFHVAITQGDDAQL